VGYRGYSGNPDYQFGFLRSDEKLQVLTQLERLVPSANPSDACRLGYEEVSDEIAPRQFRGRSLIFCRIARAYQDVIDAMKRKPFRLGLVCFHDVTANNVEVVSCENAQHRGQISFPRRKKVIVHQGEVRRLDKSQCDVPAST
jgi:hypothetical protein